LRTDIDLMVASIGTFIIYYVGGWDISIVTLVTFIILDVLTGIGWGLMSKSLSSEKGFDGMIKKAVILLILVVAVLLDRMLNNGTWVFRTLVAYYYIANEGISILENAVKIGLPVPQGLTKVLETMKDKGDKVV